MMGPVLRRLVAAFLLIMAASAVHAREQSPPRVPWWRTEQFVKDLKLQQWQVDKIQKVFDETVPELREQDQAVKDLEKSLSQLIKENAPETKVHLHIAQLESTRGRLATTRQFMLYRMRGILTAEQRTKFDGLYAEWTKEMERQRAQQRNRASQGHGAKPGQKNFEKSEPRPENRNRP